MESAFNVVDFQIRKGLSPFFTGSRTEHKVINSSCYFFFFQLEQNLDVSFVASWNKASTALLNN